jgi:AcrR family transcriptional regulator
VKAAEQVAPLRAAPERFAVAADMRGALLDTAERLMAERGIRAVGLKEISVRAGQRNNSAAQYHYGDRANLVEAVFVDRMTGVNATRHRMLDILSRQTTAWGIRPLVDIEIEPLLNVVGLGGGSWFACSWHRRSPTTSIASNSIFVTRSTDPPEDSCNCKHAS